MSSLKWYAIRSQPRKEELLNRQLIARGFESFYPRLRVHPVNPRSRKFQPYFPGYLFVRADLEQVGISVLQWMPYGSGLVAFSGEPSSLADMVILTIQQRVDEINNADKDALESLHPGDQIHVQSGIFAGYEGIFDTRLSGTERVRVLLNMLNQSRSIPVELSARTITKLDPKD
jgi:transcription antitermination factor NusG